MRTRIVFAALLAIGPLVPGPSSAPAIAGERSEERVAFWVEDGAAVVGYARVSNGRVSLRAAHQDGGKDPEEVRLPLEGDVRSVIWSPDGASVAFYDSGRGNYRVIVDADPGEVQSASVDPDLIRDRGGWLWKQQGEAKPGLHSILDSGPGAQPADQWAYFPPPRFGQVRPSRPAPIHDGDRDISRFVTAMAARPRAGALISVEPYSVNGGETRRRQAYLARMSNGLDVVERLGPIGGARSLSVSAGGTRVAMVTRDGDHVRVLSLPGLRRLAEYPNLRKAGVSFAPDGSLGIGGPSGSVIRTPGGSRVVFPPGITWFRFQPCVGAYCARQR